MNRPNLLLNMFGAMLDALGPSRWWPGETPFEVAVGAVLTQNTAWSNAARAVANLKNAGVFDPAIMYAMPDADMAEHIRPAGYFRLKTKRLKSLLRFITEECGGDIASLAGGDMDEVREKLLGIKGVGPETADSILLYALEYPSFVVDAYTARIAGRHMLAHEDVDYHELRACFMDALPEDVRLYNEYHALLVRVGHAWCKPKAGRCGDCPLEPFLQ